MPPMKNDYTTSIRNPIVAQVRLTPPSVHTRVTNGRPPASPLETLASEAPVVKKLPETNPLIAETEPGSAVMNASDQSENAQPTAPQKEPAYPIAGDKLTIALSFSMIVGPPNVERAKLTLTTLRDSKKQKIDQFVMTDQALDVLIRLIRSASGDDDLYRIVGRFIADHPLPE